ncbi:hypothetical protein OROGR_023685 [Orobanche gracilis]
MMPICKKGGGGRERERGGLVMVIASVRELIVWHRTSGPVIYDLLNLMTGRESSADPHEPVHTDSQFWSSPIQGPHQTASSSAQVVQ